MFTSLDYLKNGTRKQQQAFECLQGLCIMENLVSYQPTLCGTIPLNIDIEDSDLDIIVEVNDLQEFSILVSQLYRHKPDFQLKKEQVRKTPAVTCSFAHKGFIIEIFAQNQPVTHQNAYRHMVIEHEILKEQPDIRNKIIELKRQGLKTEPAFCLLLGLDGDPYEELLQYGKHRKIIPF
ncbi:DUF4269 domain-containing protein [Bacillus sp. 1P06AnD]|uniref:DUF4269 domain-containing protein n=1 Tax=Bacillus sp. 1P06AnD TaxID=3132208 RepID=UPI0039A1947B